MQGLVDGAGLLAIRMWFVHSSFARMLARTPHIREGVSVRERLGTFSSSLGDGDRRGWLKCISTFCSDQLPALLFVEWHEMCRTSMAITACELSRPGLFRIAQAF